MRDDFHGKLVKAKEIKLYRGGTHTWKMKLSQIHRMSGKIYIMTYSLPRIEYGISIFEKRKHGIQMICHKKFIEKAREYKKAIPEIEIKVMPNIHSKIIIIEPETIYLGSENFGNSTWHETQIGLKNKELVEWYLKNDFFPQWDAAENFT